MFRIGLFNTSQLITFKHVCNVNGHLQYFYYLENKQNKEIHRNTHFTIYSLFLLQNFLQKHFLIVINFVKYK